MDKRKHNIIYRNNAIISEMSKRSGFTFEECGEFIRLFRDSLIDASHNGVGYCWPGLFTVGRVDTTKKCQLPHMRNIKETQSTAIPKVVLTEGLRNWLRGKKGYSKPTARVPRYLAIRLATQLNTHWRVILPILVAFKEIVTEAMVNKEECKIWGVGYFKYYEHDVSNSAFIKTHSKPIVTVVRFISARPVRYVHNPNEPARRMSTTVDVLRRMRVARNQQ